MKTKFAGLVIVASMLTLGAVASACDSGGSLTLEEFFDEVQALDDDLEAKSTDLEPQFDELTEESGVDEVADLFREQAALIDDFVEGLADLDPPDEAADVHDEAVSAGREVVDAFNSSIGDAQEAELIEGFFEGFETGDFIAADERFTQACLEAEQLAADNGITVDFTCEDEDE